MAMEGAEISVAAMSPRISFSQDFIHNEPIPVEQRPSNLRSPFNSSFDFDFCIRECPDLEPSSADEIFSHGKILPLQIKPPPPPPLTPPKSLDAPPPPRFKKSDPHKQGGGGGGGGASHSKSFWHFKRSTSCGSGYTRSLCPLPLLSRSNSTGSTPKRTPLPKDKHASLTNHNNSQTTPYHKPPLKKPHASNLHGLQVNPILNLHSGNLFGLASIFSSSPKDRTANKKVGVSSVFVFWLGRNILDCGSIIGIFFISYFYILGNT